MAKTPKLGLSFFLHSLQFCRPKDPSSLVSTPLSAAMFSPDFGFKSYDVSFPSFPEPPPSTPTDHRPSSKRGAIAPSKISPSPLGNRSCDHQTKPNKILHGNTPALMKDEFSSHSYLKTGKKDKEKMYNSPVSSDSDHEGQARLIAPTSNNEKKKERGTRKKPKASISSVNSDYESDVGLFSSHPSPISVHNDSAYPSKAATYVEEEKPLNRSKKMTQVNSDKTRRFKRFGSKKWKDGVLTAAEIADDRKYFVETPVSRTFVEAPVSRRSVDSVQRALEVKGKNRWKDGGVTAEESVDYHKCRMEMPVSRRSVDSIQRMADGKGKNSFVVLKKSMDPYEDFKKSMLEMILEKQIFEPKELEQLLMSFLSLNSRIYHRVITEAFIEIWKELFCGTH